MYRIYTVLLVFLCLILIGVEFNCAWTTEENTEAIFHFCAATFHVTSIIRVFLIVKYIYLIFKSI